MATDDFEPVAPVKHAVIDLRESTKPVHLWNISDVHIGHKDHAYELFLKHLRLAKRRGWRVGCWGDLLEWVTVDSRVALFGAMWEQNMTPQEQVDAMTKLLAGHTVDFILPGNHDGDRQAKVQFAAPREMVQRLRLMGQNTHYFTTAVSITYLVGEQEYHIFGNHGVGPYRNPVGLAERQLARREGYDAIVGGHIHETFVVPKVVYLPYEKTRRVWWVRTGHYLDNPDYQERRVLGVDGAMGSVLFTMDPKEHKFWAEPVL